MNMFGGVGLGFACLSGAGWYFMNVDGGVYPMSVAQAQQRLIDTPIYEGKWSPFGMYEASASATDANTVTWTAVNDDGATMSICVAKLEAVDVSKTKVTHACEAPGSAEMAAGGTSADMAAIKSMKLASVGELIDSALDGRAYNPDKVAAASGAIALKALPQMQRDALKMGIEDAQMRAEMRASGDGSSAYTDYASE